ncbi:hypothetical protein QEG98_42115 (plasmid) [Myxococcus sp. MxC21-1]|uniref:hypothetical protein n=1 Tax=Myxococcus sp. MxC21-1 TaxID=3041439 RepID=UPI00292FF395|nr:hypothetical protein [Myxococcus sp. MxC21-1]WNZ66217.1 hypothetical protein QEG98_42115 [Myxococcus sp. MxC21-1]
MIADGWSLVLLDEGEFPPGGVLIRDNVQDQVVGTFRYEAGNLEPVSDGARDWAETHDDELRAAHEFIAQGGVPQLLVLPSPPPAEPPPAAKTKRKRS